MKTTAAIILYNSKKQLLLNQRSDDAPKNPGKWSFFGGHVEEGEKPLNTVIRETKEELDVTIQNPSFLYTAKSENMNIFIFVHPFSQEMQITQKEGKAKGWFTIDEARKLDSSPEVKNALEQMKSEWEKFISAVSKN